MVVQKCFIRGNRNKLLAGSGDTSEYWIDSKVFLLLKNSKMWTILTVVQYTEYLGIFLVADDFVGLVAV